MAEKVLKTRVKLLYKSYADWQLIKDTFVPLYGEVCLTSVPASTGAVVDEPAVLFKVGDGTHTYGELPFGSAKAADVHEWAKKSTLDWNDLSAEFKDTLATYINTTMSALAAQVATNTANIAKKVDKKIVGTNGTADIFNESDGGGAMFTHNDGTKSFVGVNDEGHGGITAQIYSKNTTTNVGARLNISDTGIYYTNGKTNGSFDANDELATKKDIQSIVGAMHFRGVIERQEGETDAQAIARVVTDPADGDVVIMADNSKEYIYDGTNWKEVGDESLYATKAALQAEAEARAAADEALENSLATIAKTGNVNDLIQTEGDVLILDCNL